MRKMDRTRVTDSIMSLMPSLSLLEIEVAAGTAVENALTDISMSEDEQLYEEARMAINGMGQKWASDGQPQNILRMQTPLTPLQSPSFYGQSPIFWDHLPLTPLESPIIRAQSPSPLVLSRAPSPFLHEQSYIQLFWEMNMTVLARN